MKNLHSENSNIYLFENVLLPTFNIEAPDIISEIERFRSNFLSSNFQLKIDEARGEIKNNHNIDMYEQSLKINEFEKSLKLFENIDNIINILDNRCSYETYYPQSELLNGNEANIALIQNLPRFITIQLIDSRTGIEYSDLSTGERSLLEIIYSIKNLLELRIRNSLSDDIFLLLDEIESYLHPNWQKKIFFYIFSFIREYKINMHIILASHSPFILSDLPKENVIFLKEGKQVDVDIDTFGANIHTLLSHGFFMKDGLMGEFAKEKINKAITLLNQPKRLSRQSMKYCENIISIIGEPILKKQLQKMLDSKRLHKMDEIDRLKADISALHQKLKKLEGRK